MSNLMRAAAVLLLVVSTSRLLAQEHTVRGPETDKLLPNAQGYILMSSSHTITAVRLPDLQERTIQPFAGQRKGGQRKGVKHIFLRYTFDS